MQRLRLVSFLLVSLALPGCDPADLSDGGTPPSDAGSRPDGGAWMDAGVGPDAATVDAGGADAGLDLDASVSEDASPDAASDAGRCLEFDAGLDGVVPDGSVVCPPAPVLDACPGATPALDFAFTMTSTTPSGGATTDVRGRHFLDEMGRLSEQRTREQMASPSADLLRIWRSSMPMGQLLYTIDPPTPDPFTLAPKARLDRVGTDAFFNGLATFPSYAEELIACLDAVDTVACLDARGRFTDTGTTQTVEGNRCRVMTWGDESLSLCVPSDCDARRTLYPYWVRGPSGISVTFDALSPSSHPDPVVVEPAPCEMPVPMLTLCDHPDL